MKYIGNIKQTHFTNHNTNLPLHLTTYTLNLIPYTFIPYVLYLTYDLNTMYDKSNIYIYIYILCHFYKYLRYDINRTYYLYVIYYILHNISHI